MTEVFIGTVQTTKIDLNDEQLQFYREKRLKQIYQVRQSLQELHRFSNCIKKDKSMINYAAVWTSLMTLSNIIGYQTEFNEINRLNIPENVLVEQLVNAKQVFINQQYGSREIFYKISHDNDSLYEKYYILLTGIVEKQFYRSSIQIPDNKESNPIRTNSYRLNKSEGSRFNKKNKKRFSRTQEEIPICINSKRSQNRIDDINAGVFRAVTNVQLLEIDKLAWKKYVESFSKLEEEYIMNFIRKSLNLNLNFNYIHENQKEASCNNSQTLKQQKFYEIVYYNRKNVFEFNHDCILLLLKGQILIESFHYKILISKGCILNTSILLDLDELSQNYSHNHAYQYTSTARTKAQSVVIKIDMTKLQTYFMDNQEDEIQFRHLLENLENNRRVNRDSLQKNMELDRYAQSKSKFNTKSKYFVLKTEGYAGEKRKKIFRHLFQNQEIQDKISKVQKVASLKNQQYLRKHQFTQQIKMDFEKCQHRNMIMQVLPHTLFQTCMSNIQLKKNLLKDAVALKNISKTKEVFINKSQNAVSRHINKLCKHNGTAISQLRRKIKDFTLHTEHSQNLMNIQANYSQAAENLYQQRKYGRQTIGNNRQVSEYPYNLKEIKHNKEIFLCHPKWLGQKLGIMKKIKSGQIRRIKAF